MPRVCARMGCGTEIPFDRFFCGPECKNEDKAEKMRVKRRRRRHWITVNGARVGVLKLKTLFEIGRALPPAPIPQPKGKGNK